MWVSSDAKVLLAFASSSVFFDFFIIVSALSGVMLDQRVEAMLSTSNHKVRISFYSSFSAFQFKL